MIVLLLVELLQVGRVIALAVRSHLVPHLSLLSCLQDGKENITHRREYCEYLFAKPVC